MNLNDVLIENCNRALLKQQEDGSFPAGRNGPHGHRMTRVRNTAHLAVAMAEAYKKTGQDSYLRSSKLAIEYMTSEQGRPLNGAFWKRIEDHKSSYNGLIGQAWCLEALIFCGEVYGGRAYIELAQDIYSQHKFNSERGLWYQVDLDGTAREIDMTLNQQIWIASIGAWLSNYFSANNRNLTRFLDALPKNYLGNMNLFNQLIKSPSVSPKGMLKRLLNIKQAKSPSAIEKNIGYHIFTVCGLARIYESFYGHNYFKSREFRRKLNACFSVKLEQELERNKYSYFYNVPGYEIAYIWSVFEGFLDLEDKEAVKRMLNKQAELHLSKKTNCKRVEIDEETFFARVYEIYRLPESMRNFDV